MYGQRVALSPNFKKNAVSFYNRLNYRDSYPFVIKYFFLLYNSTNKPKIIKIAFSERFAYNISKSTIGLST